MGVNILLKKFLGKRKTKIIIIVVLLLYMLITGFSSSLFRASLMGILVILSEILYRKNDIWNSISISLFILLIYNPFLITNVGLQFSYLGTIGIILFNKTILNIFKRKKENSITLKIKEMLSVTISAQIMILPIMIYHFNIFSVYFFISNLFVSIIIGPIIILGSVTIILSFFLEPIAEILFCILEIAIKLLLSVTSIR
jgi:competence protein ComEC